MISGASKFHLKKNDYGGVFALKKKLDIQLSINNQPVKVEARAKFLGLLFDFKLNSNRLLCNSI